MVTLVLILIAAFTQDVLFTSKVALVSHNKAMLAMGMDALAMFASLLYVVLTADTAISNGLSVETVLAFVAVVVGGTLGTGTGMLWAAYLEKTFHKPVTHRLRDTGC